MLIKSVAIKPDTEQYRPLGLNTSRGTVECRYYMSRDATSGSAPGVKAGVVWLGGAGGGWDSPADGLYARVCPLLAYQGISSLWVRYRRPSVLKEAVLDALTGIAFLESEGVAAVGLVGHSLGGAVAIQAAIRESVCTVVALATQSYGAEAVAGLAPRCSILLIHGESDRVLPPYCSQWVYFLAGGLKRLVLYPGADHGLDEVSSSVTSLVVEWLKARLSV